MISKDKPRKPSLNLSSSSTTSKNSVEQAPVSMVRSSAEPILDENNEPVKLRHKATSAPNGEARKQCRVLFSYAPAHEDELELRPEDVVDFLGEVEDGWWRGCVNGKTGVFPSNFVSMMPAATAPVTAPAPAAKPAAKHSANDSVVESKNRKNSENSEWGPLSRFSMRFVLKRA